MTKLTLQEAIKSRPDLPVIVFVDNYELAYDYDTTAQTITRAEVAEVVQWERPDNRIYCDEDEFVEDYVTYAPRDASEDELEAEARELWKEHAKECIVCYSHAVAMPKGCEIE